MRDTLNQKFFMRAWNSQSKYRRAATWDHENLANNFRQKLWNIRKTKLTKQKPHTYTKRIKQLESGKKRKASKKSNKSTSVLLFPHPLRVLNSKTLKAKYNSTQHSRENALRSMWIVSN